MKDYIDNINCEIIAKSNQLKKEVNLGFSEIVLPNALPSVNNSNSHQSSPPISYILYGVAGLSALGALTISEFKWIGLGLTAFCAFGGYKLSKQNKKQADKKTQDINLDELKNAVSSKVLSILKNVSGEWDDFMQETKTSLPQMINNSGMSLSQKDEMMNKIFIHEVFDIRMIDFNNQMNNVNSISELKTTIESFKSKLLIAIDNTANKQISKYNSMLN